jgi:hypothetical protein
VEYNHSWLLRKRLSIHHIPTESDPVLTTANMSEAKPRVACLKSKEDWPTWSVGIRMELRAQKCFISLTQDVYLKSEDLEEDDLRDRCKEWLTEDNEVPEGGFTAAKVRGNLGKYKKYLDTERQVFNNANGQARSIIYNSYNKSFQSLLSPYRKGTARQMWDYLKKYCEIKCNNPPDCYKDCYKARARGHGGRR